MKNTETQSRRSQQRMVGRAISKYVASSRKWNADCNQRPMKTPDAKQRQLADESCKAFDALVRVINKCTSNNHSAQTRSPIAAAPPSGGSGPAKGL